MRVETVVLIAKQFFKKAFFTKGLLVLMLIFWGVLVYVAVNGWRAYEKYHHSVEHHQETSRESWEANPNKHPHRMAHFGSFAFRLQHPLRIFDSGIETYTGNSMYLEAHKQNTANFSEATLSTGLVRFGDLNIAILLQLILPLIIFFIGYSSITYERENGTLKIIYLQGANMRQILLGKTLGLFMVSALFFVPALITLWVMTLMESHVLHTELILRVTLISVCYLLFFIVLCGITIIISAWSKNSNTALLRLLGGWLLFFIIIPKTAQVLGNSIFPNLSRIEFCTVIEEEVAKQGDSHNPNDPYFNTIRDSLLRAYNVDAIKDLPINYGGFIMSRGEAQTAKIYKDQHEKLVNTYRKQNSISNGLVFINPYLAIKNLSMSLSATDFDNYVNFLEQTEAYRYKQSQYMNELQMKFISNDAKGSEGKVHVVNKSYWKAAPKFNFEFLSVANTLDNQITAILAIGIWSLLILIIITNFSNQFKII